MDRFLSDDIDVSFSEEHPLPWHPPICERLADTVEGIDDIPGIKERHTLTTRNRDPHAVPYLMKYGYQGVEAEIGQRISSAMKRVKFFFLVFPPLNFVPKSLPHCVSRIMWDLLFNNMNMSVPHYVNYSTSEGEEDC